MRIAFLGVQGTGKSTLIKKIQDEKLLSYPESPSVGRQMKAAGFVINEDAGSLDQSIALNYHLINWTKDNMLYARTFMDALVYAQYAFNHGKITLADLNLAKEITKAMMPKYDILFYIEPEFDIVADGDRSTDVAFRDECAQILKNYIKEFDLKVIQLTGSVDARFELVRSVFEERAAAMIRGAFDTYRNFKNKDFQGL